MSKYARTAGPPQVPCRATVGQVGTDGTGELVTDGGMTVRFGRYACRGFAPQAGMAVWINLFVPDPDTRGYKAAIINALDDRRMADAIDGNRLRHDRKRRELALLVRHGLADLDAYWPRLVERAPADRRALAADLVQLRRDSHLFDDLFVDLVTLEPELFHPFLAELDWRSEPELLAWTRAPYASVEFAAALLENATAIVLQRHVPVGTVGQGRELARRDRAPHNDVAAAVLALAHSAAPPAIAALSGWVRRAHVAIDELNQLLLITGWHLHDGTLRRISGQRPAWHARPAAGPGRQFAPSRVRCPRCGTPLVRLFDGAPADVVPFPLYTCLDCAMDWRNTYYVALQPNEEPSPIEAPTDEPPLERPRTPPPAPFTVVFERAPQAIPHGTDRDNAPMMARVGGAPSWNPLQGPLLCGLRCPACDLPMEFLAQFAAPHPTDTEGMYYVFGCTGCRVSATAFDRY